MLTVSLYVFWISFLIVGFTYVGYGVVLFLVSTLKKVPTTLQPSSSASWPPVTLLIAAYNEEEYIEAKIINTLALDYPKEALELFFITDGSTDRTMEVVKRYPALKLFHEDERKGKIHAVNRVMKFVKTPFVIFSDANTALNKEAIQDIVRHYQDKTIGGVAGEKRIITEGADGASTHGEGFYWRYESALKKLDSKVYSVVGAAGELFSLRTSLYEEPPADTIIEDFYISLRVASRGFRIVYEPDAYAMETGSLSVAEEWKRKVRITAGGFQAMLRLRNLLNPFRYGVLSFLYIGHRVLRWTLAPLGLLLLLISSLMLAINGSLIYSGFLLLQVLFYCAASIGHLLRARKIKVKTFFVPYYFTVMNLSVYAGFVKFVTGRQSVVWEKAKRAGTREPIVE